MRITLAIVAAAALPGHRQEPAPRHLTPIQVKVTADLATISGAREMKDGRILISDAKRAAVYIIDPKAGTMQQIGSPGGGEGQYAQPGGFYSGIADTVYLLDRAQARVLAISPTGSIVSPRSIRQKGVTASSDLDQDLQQVDSRGLAYFTQRGFRLKGAFGAKATDSLPLLRFDASRQHYDTVALLRQAEKKITQQDEHFQMTRPVHGSPRDGWGTAFDGSVAIVRGFPYRVDWISPTGKVTRGPVIQFEPIAYTAEEKTGVSQASAKSAPSAGVVSADGSESKLSRSANDELFASTKTAFESDGIIVSTDAHVWVPRTQRATAKTVLYDVFDRQGERTDRVEFPASSRVIGFGPGAVFTVERDEHGAASLHKYKI